MWHRLLLQFAYIYSVSVSLFGIFCYICTPKKEIRTYNMNNRTFLRSFIAAIFCLFVGIGSVSAQEFPLSASDKVVDDPDVMPFYTGGTGEMHKFISRSLRYPADARERNAQGLVVYTFVVEKDGSLSNFNIIHRADSLLNQEALRILKSMPAWRPARHKGEIVRAETYVPMYFKLNKNARRTTNQACPVQQVAKTNEEVADQTIYSIVDEMPTYENGDEGLVRFIVHNLKYPTDAYEQGVEGRVLCSFIVGDNGQISNIEVVNGLFPSLDAEAIRLLSIMPKWNPGKNNGKNVNVKCVMPFDFKITETTSTAS